MINSDYNYYRIRAYADIKRVTSECVRKWIKQGKVETTIISGTTFVIEPKNEKGK